MQPDSSRQYAKLPPREVPVLGPSETDKAVLFHVEESHARDLISQGKLTLGPQITKHIRALRIVPPSPPKSEKACPLRTKSAGDTHCNDTLTNPQGVWAYFPFPVARSERRFIRSVFTQVLDSCLEKRV